MYSALTAINLQPYYVYKIVATHNLCTNGENNNDKYIVYWRQR